MFLFSKLPPNQRRIVGPALNALPHAYHPSTPYAVAAVVEAQHATGKYVKIFTGVNVETKACSPMIHAEQAAIAAAINAGYPRLMSVVAITHHITKNDPTFPCIQPPCGTCRQLIWELCQAFNTIATIYLPGKNCDEITTKTIIELLQDPCSM